MQIWQPFKAEEKNRILEKVAEAQRLGKVREGLISRFPRKSFFLAE
jgi:hypothetical protein